MALFVGVVQLTRRVQKVAARLIEDGEGLKEEIAAERGPWRACQPPHDEIFRFTFGDSPADGIMVYLD